MIQIDSHYIGRRIIYNIPIGTEKSFGYNVKLRGEHGIIVGVIDSFYQIEFDNNLGIHNCGGLAKDGHGFNVSPIFLTLLDKEEYKLKWYKKGKFFDD